MLCGDLGTRNCLLKALDIAQDSSLITYVIRADVSNDVLEAFQTSKMVSKDHVQAILVEVIPWCKQIIPSLYLGLKKHRNKQGANKNRNQQNFMSALRDTFLSLQIFLGTDDLKSSQGFDEIRSLTIRLRWSLCHLCALGPVMMVDSSLGWILFRVGCESNRMVDMIQVKVQESANSVDS